MDPPSPAIPEALDLRHSPPQRVLFVGASGFLGRHIAATLTAHWHTAVPVSRRRGLDMTNFDHPEAWQPLLMDIDAVINAAGILVKQQGQTFEAVHVRAPQALFEACMRAGVARVIQVSALGADDSAFSTYHLSKRAADDALRRISLDWFILRPSLVHGADGDSARVLLRCARLPRIPVLGTGRQRIQPVLVEDVCATVLACLRASQARQTLDVVGAEPLDFAQWLQRLRATQGLPQARLLHIPTAWAYAFVALAGWISPLLRRENLRMREAGNVADARPLARFLGRPLATISPVSHARAGGTHGEAS
ncbi:MAG: NAD(P)H-binding protein [Pseudacidovorax sp.]|nr:NAD(P)H-binding protein [Pseudacidovorax sp.]